MNQSLPNSQSSSSESDFSIWFPAFEKLFDHMVSNGVSDESAGFVIGRITRDLWEGASLQAKDVVGEESYNEISQVEDIGERMQLLMKAYHEKTGKDMKQQLERAADMMVEPLMNDAT